METKAKILIGFLIIVIVLFLIISTASAKPKIHKTKDLTLLRQNFGFTAQSQEPQRGDFNDDGKVNADDTDLLRDAINNGAWEPEFDVNNDGIEDEIDFQYMINIILKTQFGDANLNKKVDALDLSLLRTNFGTSDCLGSWTCGNFNLDSIVDAQDLSLLRQNFGFDNFYSANIVICGNGVIEGGEECDDNNTLDGDGCNSNCQINNGWTCTQQPSICIQGDFNSDGEVNVDDIDLLCTALVITATDPKFDTNNDDLLGLEDFIYMVHIILQTQFGDTNLDKKVDAIDLAILRTNFGNDPSGWASGNFNCYAGGTIDAQDLSLLRQNFGFDNFYSANIVICGNGVIEGGEECDDNNTLDGDGCNSNCQINNGWTCTQQPSICIQGDFNDDGIVNTEDVDLLRTAINTNDANPRFDLTLDGVLNKEDFDYMIHNVLQTQFGDTNLDKKVDAIDLAILRINLGNYPLGWASGNFNLDDHITDVKDLALLRTNFGFDNS